MINIDTVIAMEVFLSFSSNDIQLVFCGQLLYFKVTMTINKGTMDLQLL